MPLCTLRSLMAVSFLTTAPLLAQIRHAGVPASDQTPLPAAPTAILLAPTLAEFERQASTQGLDVYRYGAAVVTSVDSATAGRWDVLPALGVRVWRVRLASAGAHSLGVLFDRFDPAPGGQVFLYDDARSELFGAYTEANEKANGMLAVQPVPGQAVTIEYVESLAATAPATLRVGEVVHDYRDVLAALSGAPIDNGPCQIDINCPEGAPYQSIKRACVVAMRGGGLCSASILNNTANDGTPYLLTATHCGDMTNGVFVFNFERTGCGTGPSSMNETVSGATFLASSPTPTQLPATVTDSQLYRISVALPLSYEPMYAGWDRTGSQPTGAVATLGHGLGLPRKVAVDANGATTFGSFWSAAWTSGIANFGNSGGPLFSGSLRVLGPACCVTNFDCGQQTTFFGRFDQFWNQGALAQWLDPLGTGAMTIDAYDPLAAGATYCTPGASGSTIAAIGSSSVAVNDLELRAMNVPSGEFGIFFYGDAPAQFPLGLGTVCVGGGMHRLLPALLAEPNGQLVRVLDLGAPPTPSGQITAGSTWNFQGWFRSGVDFDFSNAVQVTFTP